MGYGDISPSDSVIGQLIVMGMIIAAIVVVPVQITTVVDRCVPNELPVTHHLTLQRHGLCYLHIRIRIRERISMRRKTLEILSSFDFSTTSSMTQSGSESVSVKG